MGISQKADRGQQVKIGNIKLIFMLLLLISCSYNPNYLRNRKNDFLDIINIGFEKEYYGVRLNLIFPVIINLGFASNSKGIGLMHGRFGKYILADPNNQLIVFQRLYFSNTNFGNNFDSFMYEIKGKKEMRDSLKEYKIIFIRDPGCSSKARAIYKNQLYICSVYYTNPNYFYLYFLKPEIAFGINYGIRFGFSFSETLDFFLGIFGIDFMDDDYDKEGKVKEIQMNQLSKPDKILTDEEVKEYIKAFEEYHKNGTPLPEGY